MSVKLKDLVIDAEKTLGAGLILVTAPRPAFDYLEKVRQDTFSAMNYDVLVPNLSFEKVVVKVGGTEPIIPKEEWIGARPITLSRPHLEVSQNYKTGEIRVWVTAEAIRLVQEKG